MKRDRPFRLYLDTSVFGGCFDAREGWDVDSLRVVSLCANGVAVLLTSRAVEEELEQAPEDVANVLLSVPASQRERLEIDDEVEDLADAYIRAGVVSVRWREDCVHVAAATVNRADAIVSWNFRHLVRLDRIKGFNAVNLAEGYGILTILSPREVNIDDD